MAHRSNSLFVFLIKDTWRYFQIRKLKKQRNNAAVFHYKYHVRGKTPWFKISEKVCWYITFFEAAPLYWLIVQFIRFFYPRRFHLTSKDIGMINWTRSYSYFYFPESINKKFMQENELGWSKDYLTGEYTRHKSRMVKKLRIEGYKYHDSSYQVRFLGLLITLLFKNEQGDYVLQLKSGTKRCDCDSCEGKIPGSIITPEDHKSVQRKNLWFRFLHQPSTEEPLSHYFVTVPRFVERVIFSSPVATTTCLRVISWFVSLWSKDGRTEFTYQGEFQSIQNHEVESLRTVERLAVEPPDWEYDWGPGIDVYKDYVNNQFYNWWQLSETKGDDSEEFKKAYAFTIQDSLKSLLISRGFSEKSIPRVHIIRMVKHPPGDYLAYV